MFNFPFPDALCRAQHWRLMLIEIESLAMTKRGGNSREVAFHLEMPPSTFNKRAVSRQYPRPLLFVVLLVCGGVAWHLARAAAPVLADRIVIEKAKRTLTLYAKGKVLKTYLVALGTNPVGPKQQEGDGKTPEGVYWIDWRNPQSKFHLSLHLTYPNEADAESARKRGVPAGGDIMIHGLPNGIGALGAAHRLHRGDQ